MHLKKLELFGFKSFADKTLIHFDRGVTCVVGPNGCGKSNISDSIRWVLGERSAKMLRGSKMEDVIFNGTDFRKPIGMAEVSLTIDNEDRGLPIDYAEVTLTRRLYRSGESEYLINKTVCRLKDIQDLILDTGIGSNSYSMIEQGRIDYILNADPETRRFLIEEAAGISKYKVKKEEALRKLEKTEENILRLNDIIQEVFKNIQYAERQARRAERYKEQFDKLKDLEIRRAFRDRSALESESAQTEERKAASVAAMADVQANKQQCRSELAQLEESLRELNSRLQREEARRYELKALLEQFEQQLKFNEDKRLEYATRTGQLEQEKLELSLRTEKNAREIQQRREEEASVNEELGRADSDTAFAQNELHKIEAALESSKQSLEQVRTETFELASRTAKTRNDLHRHSVFLETSGEQLAKLRQNLERYEQEVRSWRDKFEANAGGLEGLRQKAQTISQDADQLTVQKNEMRAGLEALADEIKNLEGQLHQKGARLGMLHELDVSLGLNIDSICQGHEELEKNLIKGIRDIVRVRPGYEKALEAALGDFSKFLIARNAETAVKLARRLEGENQKLEGLLVCTPLDSAVGDTGFCPLENSSVDCALLSVTEIDPEYAGLLTPFLSGTYVVRYGGPDDIPALLELSKDFTLVTQGGICFSKSRKITLGQGAVRDQSLFQRGNEMESLQNDIAVADAALAERRRSRWELDAAFLAIEDRLTTLQTLRMDTTIANESLESVQTGISERLHSYEREMDLIRFEIKELENQRAESQTQKTLQENELIVLTAAEKSAADKLEAFQHEIQVRDEERGTKLRLVAELESRLLHLRERSHLIAKALELLRETDAQARERLQFIDTETVRIGAKVMDLAGSDETIRGRISTAAQESEQVQVSLSLLGAEKQGLEQKASEKQHWLETLNNREKEIESELHQCEIKSMDLSYRARTLEEKIRQTYHVELAALQASDYPLDAETAEGMDKKIEDLRSRVESLGTVNLLAIEEYDELKKRYDFLTGQKADMEQARESLLEAIRKINRTTKGLFESTFQTVAQTFREYFQTLFQGGDAKLVLIDESQPLESGIDIIVRPPGKKLQSMTLLSGGEKALTAIAMLCALFKVKPSPFCVMDEVDAPLDEANVDRFLKVVRTFLDSSQFILVTHNRKTIAMGDSLYGVTMEEAGVSKLVSVKINQNEKSSLQSVQSEPAAQASDVKDKDESAEDNILTSQSET